MTRVTFDAVTLAKIQGSGDLVEICDEAGRIVGHFYRFREPPRDSNGKIISPISDEELERRSRDLSGRSLEEILEDLQKL